MYIRIYDKDHKFIENIRVFDKPVTTHTLNGVCKFTFNISLSVGQCNSVTLKFMNHIEFVSDNEEVIWWGIIVSRNFDFPNLIVGCYGYLHLLRRRCLPKVYSEKEYGLLIEEMLNDINELYPTGVTFGLADKTSRTQRTTQAIDFVDEKMLEYVTAAGYYLNVDIDRKLNIKTTIENDREYTIQFISDGENNNILKMPLLEQSIIDTTNNCYGEVEVFQEGAEETILLYHEAKNDESIKEYGRVDGVTSLNDDIVLQDTVINYVEEDLKKRAWSLNNVTLSIADTLLCPLDTLRVGYEVRLIIEPYFDLDVKTKVLEITKDWKTNTAKIVVGETIYKPTKPVIKFY